MTTRCSYVDGGWGQVHVRRAGDEGPWVVLLHESPLSSVVFEEVLDRLAPHVRAVALDTPGYGASTPPPANGREIPEYAAAMAPALAELGVERPVLLGLHTGASIALELAGLVAGGAAGVVLSGVPLFTPHERDEHIAGWSPAVVLDADGSQFAWAIARYQRIWPQLSPEMLHLAVVELMRVASRYDWAYHAAFRYDPADALRAVPCPVLLLDPEHDLLAAKDQVALELRPDAELVVLEGFHGQPHLRAPDDYARHLLDFVRRTQEMAHP